MRDLSRLKAMKHARPFGSRQAVEDEPHRPLICGCGCGCNARGADPFSGYCRDCAEGDCPTGECRTCDGFGEIRDRFGEMVSCPKCYPPRKIPEQQDCPQCKGTGEIKLPYSGKAFKCPTCAKPTPKCEICDGSGENYNEQLGRWEPCECERQDSTGHV
jgi:hypothetical protein